MPAITRPSRRPTTTKGPNDMTAPRTIALAGALVISAILGGALMGAVAAAPDLARGSQAAEIDLAAALDPAAELSAAPGAAAAGEYCVAYRAAFAKALGVTEAEIGAAARSAIASTIDAAVADGDLTAAAAERIKTRLAKRDAGTDLCSAIAGRGGLVKAALGIARDALNAAADTLGMEPADLRAQLRDGADLHDIAAAKGVGYPALTKAILDAVKTDLDAAVAAGTITAERETKILERFADRLDEGHLRRAR
jgi:hypothetical protein